MNEQAGRPDEEIEERAASETAADVEESGTAIETDEEVSELERAEATAAENWDRYLRAAAELENVRKRARRDIEKRTSLCP